MARALVVLIPLPSGGQTYPCCHEHQAQGEAHTPICPQSYNLTLMSAVLVLLFYGGVWPHVLFGPSALVCS